MRQIFLDTETTGLEPEQGHRIIEIACVEMVNRKLTGKHFHRYVNPDREIEEGAIEIHGITNDFLADKPRFAQISDDFLVFIKGADLIIHNAPFDVGFINHEFNLLARQDIQAISAYCRVIDTLVMARQKHPGQKNSLDALCRRYEVDNSHRELHGALLDAEILAEVYLRMTGGQVGLALSSNGVNLNTSTQTGRGLSAIQRLPATRSLLPVIKADGEELLAHQKKLEKLEKACGRKTTW
jgi:DNA polymerase III subunit epsilon